MPPAALTSSAHISVPWVMPRPRILNTPERSVRLPSVISVSVTPTSVLTAPSPLAPPPEPPVCALLLQPARARDETTTEAARALASFFVLIWVPFWIPGPDVRSRGARRGRAGREVTIASAGPSGDGPARRDHRVRRARSARSGLRTRGR